MKKVIIIMVSILLVAAANVFASNPIPSYNTPVVGKANFTDGVTMGTPNTQREKRDVNVQNGAGGGTQAPTSTVLTVFVYKLDMSVVLGPFTVAAGTTLTVGIDSDAWGVGAQSDSPTLMSVWESNNQ